MLEKSDADADTQEGARDVMDTAAEPVAESDLGAITVSGHAIAKPPPPDVWIKQIIHWKHMQLNEKFEREFARFRKVYPDYELPDELANIVREDQ